MTTERTDARRIDRYEPPSYLARYRERQAQRAAAGSANAPPAAPAANAPPSTAPAANVPRDAVPREAVPGGAAPEVNVPGDPAPASTPAPAAARGDAAPAPTSAPATGLRDAGPVVVVPQQSPGPVTVDMTDGTSGDAGVPLYLRRFRARTPAAREAALSTVVHLDDAEPFTREFAQGTREKEIVAPPQRREREQFVAEIRIIRHGITQGYSTDAGLTPMGGWQAHQRGHSLSKSLTEGQQVRIVCADTSRARQTAEQIYRGMLDGMDQWQRKADVSAPEAIPELRNFGVWTPDGLRDVTSAFRQYQSMMEKLERMAVGDRPRWLVEIDRFYRTQLGGGDPIHTWLTIPMMYFEPPALCVRRFWRGFHRLIAESPDHRIIAATHSGPIRAFATWAHGYDPGEPYNTEEVVVKVRRGGRTALVAYRNRVTEVNVPPPDEFPAWES